MRPRGYLAIAVLLSAVGPFNARADTLVVCTEASPDALNAQLSTANTSFDVSEQIADRLVEMKIGGSDLVPGLAESSTKSPDGLTYTFKLRHGVKFQPNTNFKPTRDFNADDVVFSFQRMMDKSSPFYQSANDSFPEFVDLVGPNLLSIDKIDNYTVAMKLKAPLAPLLPSLSMQPFSIISAEYGASLQSGKLAALDQEPVGTGPFSFVQYQKDAVIRFRAFPEFWGKGGAQPDRVPKVDNLVFTITPDASVRYAKLRTNECQIARYLNPADLPAMRQSGHWCNQTYTDAVLKANVVAAQAERTKLYITADKAVYDDIPLVRIGDVKAYVPVRKNVEGFKLHFLGGQPFGGVSLGK